MAKSSLKEKYRYVVARVHCKKHDISKETLEKECEKKLLELHGEIGISEISPKLVRYGKEKKLALFRVIRGTEIKFIASLSLIDELYGVEARIEPIRTSGTIRGAIRQ